jgi:ABC-type lipoprotein release transport system permease subunit
MPIAVLVLIVALAVTYPALKAAFLDPVEAIHHH